MCLITKRISKGRTVAEKLKSVVKIATRDILVTKKLDKQNGIYSSPHRSTNWPKSGRNKVKAFGAVKNFDRGLSIKEGLHAYTEINPIDEYSYAAIIPKGTEYIISADRKEIVALAMNVILPPIATPITEKD